MERSLKDLIPNISKVAREVGVSATTVRNWMELNAIPPKRVIAVANALDVEIPELLEFAKRATKPPQIVQKTENDIDTLLAAYEGRPYTSNLSPRSIRNVLERWGQRLPLLCQTLKDLRDRKISVQEASDRLQITKSAVNNLRVRYGIAPGRRKADPKPLGPTKRTAKIAVKHCLDVIAGRKTARKASLDSGIPLRTLHRHIEPLLDGLSLNEISHWSPSFRLALAWETEKKHVRETVRWRKWAQDRGIVLSRKQTWPNPPKSWREAPMRRLLACWLAEELSLEELAVARGGEPSVLEGLFKAELDRMGMNPLGLSIHHRTAVAEIVLAFQRKTDEANEPPKPREEQEE